MVADRRARDAQQFRLAGNPQMRQHRERHIRQRHPQFRTLPRPPPALRRRDDGKRSLERAGDIPRRQHMIGRRRDRAPTRHRRIPRRRVDRIIDRRRAVLVALDHAGDDIPPPPRKGLMV